MTLSWATLRLGEDAASSARARALVSDSHSNARNRQHESGETCKLWIAADGRRWRGGTMVKKAREPALAAHLRFTVTLASMLSFGTLCVSVRVLAAPPTGDSVEHAAERSAGAEVVAMVQPVEQNESVDAQRSASTRRTSDDAASTTTVAEGPAAGPATKTTGTTAKGSTDAASERAGETRPKSRKVASRGRQRVSLSDDFLVEGRLEKPSAYYILRRSDADYDWTRMDAKFLPLVLESVQDPLF